MGYRSGYYSWTLIGRSSRGVGKIELRVPQDRQGRFRTGTGEVCTATDGGAHPYLILDARYEKVREDGAVLRQAVLVAIGIN